MADRSSVIVFSPITPGKLDVQAFRNEMRGMLKMTGKVIKKDFTETTRFWKTKVKFTVDFAITPEPFLEVWTDNEIYGYVNFGTDPHDIWAGIYTGKSNKKVLKFQTGYKAKTAKGRKQSRPGGPSGPFIMRPYVSHPGTDPRDFDEDIQERRQPWFEKEAQKALDRAVRSSGWSQWET